MTRRVVPDCLWEVRLSYRDAVNVWSVERGDNPQTRTIAAGLIYDYDVALLIADVLNMEEPS